MNSRLQVLLTLAVLGLLGGCSSGDHVGPPPPPPPPSGAVVSDPHQVVGAAVRGRTSLNGGGNSVFYVSMPTGTVPGALEVKIQGPSASLTALAIDGGFDPVQFTGAVGDSVQIYVLDAAGAVLASMKVGVPASTPPIVVRTQPPKKKTDVPLNGALLVLFSEPVDGATVTPPSIQLLQGTTAVSGATRFADSDHVSVEFVPAASLAANTSYQLVVTDQVRDLDGQVLAAPDTIPFTTGTTTLGPTASVTLTADTISIRGLTYQMTVLVRDAAGNELPDRPVTWAVSDPGVATISATGLLTAHAEGPVGVEAIVDGISSGWKSVYVMGGDLVSVVVRPNPDTVIQGDQTTLGATLYDARGIVLQPRPIAWSSNAPSVATVAPQFQGGTAATATGIAPGTALITAAWEGPTTISGTATLVVSPPPPVATVTLSLDTATLLKDSTLQLYATLRSATGYLIRAGATVVWSSDQPMVATVDPNGLVKAVGPGTASIAAASQGKSDTATITVDLAGSVAVTVSTTGVALDANGYEVSVFNVAGPITANATKVFTGVFPGVRVVTLGDVAVNCSATGGTSQTVSITGGATVSVSFAVVCGPITRLAFWSSWDGLIHLINTDRSGDVPLSGTQGFWPAWSADGTRIAFSSGFSSGYIYAIKADGTGLVQLTGTGTDEFPAWSPDGSKIAFGRFLGGGEREVFVINADGTASTQLTNTPGGYNSQPTWSPDGTKIAFVSARDGVYHIFVMNVDGSGVVQLTSDPAHVDVSPAWSPDGSKIAFRRDVTLYVMNADGSNPMSLNAGSDWSAGGPSWSPDGQKIAFGVGACDGSGCYGEIWVVNADGTNLARLTIGGTSLQPAWRPTLP
jgi:uncharacterized protein YjdB